MLLSPNVVQVVIVDNNDEHMCLIDRHGFTFSISAHISGPLYMQLTCGDLCGRSPGIYWLFFFIIFNSWSLCFR